MWILFETRGRHALTTVETLSNNSENILDQIKADDTFPRNCSIQVFDKIMHCLELHGQIVSFFDDYWTQVTLLHHMKYQLEHLQIPPGNCEMERHRSHVVGWLEERLRSMHQQGDRVINEIKIINENLYDVETNFRREQWQYSRSQVANFYR